MKNVLVTGGAGYIGSHMLWALKDASIEKLVVIDNLKEGKTEVLPREVCFYNAPVGDTKVVEDILQTHDIDTVLHFAALTSIPESIENPQVYAENNVQQSQRFIDACMKYGVERFVFSSSAAVYAPADSGQKLNEQSSVSSISPYGDSKLEIERYLQEIVTYYPRCSVGILRYFNVIGVSALGRSAGLLGLSASGTSLCHKIHDVIMGREEKFSLFGHTYPTPDGTAIRDFIHIDDLIEAHIALARWMTETGQSTLLNCGYGEGASVLEVLTAYEDVLGISIPRMVLPSRAGDLPYVVANVTRIYQTLDWQPTYQGRLRDMVATNCQWVLRQKKMNTQMSNAEAQPCVGSAA